MHAVVAPLTLYNKIIASYFTDAVAQQHLQDSKSPWSMDSTRLLLHHSLVYVPEPLRMSVLQQHHDAPLAGHPSVPKTLELLTRNY